MRRRVLAAAALALSLVLSACGGLPESGPVVEGRTLGEPLDEPRVLVAATGPRDGANQEEIVRGFLRAGEDSDETKQAGKLFLAPQSVDLWRWSTQDVVIYDGDLTVRKVDEETVQVSAKEVARLTPEGRFVEQPNGTRATVTLGLRKVGGEWRIDLPREGIGLWLDSDQFDRTYIPQMIYFVTPSGRKLVPDYRWFPNVSPLATTLARAQLGRVPDYLQNAVWTGVPKNTRLAVNAVPVDRRPGAGEPDQRGAVGRPRRAHGHVGSAHRDPLPGVVCVIRVTGRRRHAARAAERCLLGGLRGRARLRHGAEPHLRHRLGAQGRRADPSRPTVPLRHLRGLAPRRHHGTARRRHPHP